MEILKLNQKNYKEILKKVVKTIKEGKVLVCPTDTVYGLICDAKKKKAVNRLFKIKKRKKTKPIPIFVRDTKIAKNTAYIDKSQEEFFKKIWPGKITVILKPKRKFPKGIGKPGKEIGLRISSHKFVLNSVKHIGPLAESSANISGKPASGKIKEVLRQFRGRKYQPDLIINAGNLKPSKPSTVIDLTKKPPQILRI